MRAMRYKRVYQKPEIRQVFINHKYHLLQNSNRLSGSMPTGYDDIDYGGIEESERIVW